jgi:hypothetical protein
MIEVRPVESPASIAIGHYRYGPVVLFPGHPAGGMFAGDDPPLGVSSQTIGVVRRLAPEGHAFFFGPSIPLVVGVVAKEEVSLFAPQGTLSDTLDRSAGQRPPEAVGQPLDLRIPIGQLIEHGTQSLDRHLIPSTDSSCRPVDHPKRG